MANSTSHFVLPFPIYAAKYSLLVTYLDADGDPTDPTTPDTEISKDAGAYADCTEEVSTITGSNGTGYITLTATEMTCFGAPCVAGERELLFYNGNGFGRTGFGLAWRPRA